MRRAVYLPFIAVLGLISRSANADKVGLGVFDIEKIWSGLKTFNAELDSPDRCVVDGTHKPTASEEQNTGLCKDLFRFTCAPGDYNDGTGVGSTADSTENKVADLRKKANGYFNSQLLKAVASPENDYLRKLALSALGLTFSPACDKGGNKKQCDLRLSRGLTELASGRIFSNGAINGDPANTGIPNIKMRDLDFLINNPAYQKTEKKLAQYARDQLQDQKVIAKIKNNIFPEVRKSLIGLIQNSISDPKIRENLANKVGAIRFEGTDCSQMTNLPDDVSNPSISSLLVPNAFYDPLKNTFTYCNGFLLNNQSEFQIVSVIAHELGHSIDPCLASSGPSDFSFKYSDPKNILTSEAEYPLKGLISCLRSDKSVSAKDATTLEALAPKQKPKDTKETKNEPSQEPSPPPATVDADILDQVPISDSPFCADKQIGDQIGESVADWISAEILPKYIAKHFPKLTKSQIRIGYSNVFRGECNNANPISQSEFPVGVHPETEKRVNNIILVNPKIRQQMGCPAKLDSDSTYCSVSSGQGAK